MLNDVVVAVFTATRIVLIADHLLIVLALHDFLAAFLWRAAEKKQG
tara:strand:+ start:2172 stop:2309 length:138 start_codon:yes stop_codon:yes gene_type:complete